MRVVLFTLSICGQPGLKRAAGTAPPLHCETHMHTGLNHLAIKIPNTITTGYLCASLTFIGPDLPNWLFSMF